MEVDVVESADVVVCGAGPAGISAALSAARAGAKTTLLEVHGCLGGVWTSGCLSLIIDHENKNGVLKEILNGLGKREGLASPSGSNGSPVYDTEAMKSLLEDLACDAGIHVRLHTRVVSAVQSEQRRLTHVVTESKSGREAWKAKVFIDATGDGDLGALAGCSFEMGRTENGETQPMSLMAMLGGVKAEGIADYFSDAPGDPREAAKRRLMELLERSGKSPSYGSPTLFRIHDEMFALMANHEYGFRGTDAEDVSRATLHARREIHEIVEVLRKAGPEWSGLKLIATANQIGVREGRRIRGRYSVTTDDLVIGKTHEDAICSATFCIDVHATNRSGGTSYGNDGVRALPYQIPLRAAIAADVDGLMMAGRCISGDFLAHASYRVTGNAVEMGENVGKVAAAAAASDCLPHEVDLSKL